MHVQNHFLWLPCGCLYIFFHMRGSQRWGYHKIGGFTMKNSPFFNGWWLGLPLRKSPWMRLLLGPFSSWLASQIFPWRPYLPISSHENHGRKLLAVPVVPVNSNHFHGRWRTSHGRCMDFFLVGGWATPLKNMRVNWDDYSQYMGKQKMATKPPTSFCWYGHDFWAFQLGKWGYP